MNGSDLMGRLRNTEFVKSLRGSLVELLDELIAFASLIGAVLAGLYFASWWVFGGVLAGGLLVSVSLSRLILRRPG